MATVSKRIFSKYDKDGSGAISHDEFRSLCYDMGHCLSEAELIMALRVLDADGSGHVAYSEFLKWWQNGEGRWSKIQLSDEDLQKVEQASAYFRYFDQDASGTISREEFTNLYNDLFRNGLTTKTLDKCLEDLDTNQDGTVGFNEYIDWLARIGSLPVKVF
eukprot:TRINITY_DN18987_c0_g1::TRINITY_DN18987_c0_g1_i1::g.21614::m.21614 TRINITY_DN18987_c0_g1::TRINITY_DN18987_c0_g1_i1::g.21614  ORF type:complete len:175 (+),score=14.20,sp/Q8RZB5/CML10_ORYSJ/31.33/6e-16,EF-hand_1/PF00036.27/3.3e-07,EF-hand_1/PF00036.27/0.0036,EF-hand_1/PF00036.27/7.1e-05,EF-hand_1/PF00036.27/0.00047,EF-hand_7/PF13499.1/2.1e-07,EF-hand_7/PF13499.1/1.4e-08,EF-hand_7/PF13499.1/4.4e-10,EF-hand_5/PF13202.1/6.6e-06,EF-hand_5/PF13202.1/2.8,EF-hand_5/PF13202.1/2.9e-05,EF-hand_5/PF13202.1/0